MYPFNGIVKEEGFEYLAGAAADGPWPSLWAGGGASWELPRPGGGALVDGSSWAGGSASAAELPRPMHCLSEAGPTPFLNKTYEAVDDRDTDTVVSWGVAGESFVVWDAHAFSTLLLPRYFKHGNFASFVRQLNTYGFKKVDPDRWEFAAEGFLRGRKELLKTITRRRPQQPSTLPAQQQQQGESGQEVGEVRRRLQRDKDVLIAEVAKLRQEQQATRAQLQAMEERVAATERRQQRTTVFLARATKSPVFLRMLMDRQHMRGGEAEDTESLWMELLSLDMEEEKPREAGGGEVDVLMQSLYHLRNPE